VTNLRELADEGSRVVVRTVRPTDVEQYRRAVEASRVRLARWNPVDPDDLLRHLSRQSDVHRTFLVLARDPEDSHGVVGRINLTNVVRGRFQSGVLGYDAFDPYAGRGLFAEGLSLVVGLALRPASQGGAGLHRVEANVQPGNARSAGVLRSLGFAHEGRTPRMLLLAAPGEGERWRDHDRYAVTAEQWPASPYPPPAFPRLVVVVGGPDADRRADLAAGLATELGLPRLVGSAGADPAGGLDPETLWAVLGGCPIGAVVEVPFGPEAAPELQAGLHRAGVQVANAVQVWCTDSAGTADAGAGWGMGHAVPLEPDVALTPGLVTRVALTARALAAG
jgi:[ribosomal protein S5]-alanine N-acetyltransferase